MKEYDRKQTLCFTGHRPEKLKIAEEVVIEELKNAISVSYQAGYRNFISGMARGVDIWAAQLVLKMRKECPDISLICAIPYPGFEQRWSQSWQEQYRTILDEADEVVFVDQNHNRWIYQKRNEWMCDHASRVIAVWNGQPSGTGSTVRYAKRAGIEVVLIDAGGALKDSGYIAEKC